MLLTRLYHFLSQAAKFLLEVFSPELRVSGRDLVPIALVPASDHIATPLCLDTAKYSTVKPLISRYGHLPQPGS